jgi:hypothetical protein
MLGEEIIKIKWEMNKIENGNWIEQKIINIMTLVTLVSMVLWNKETRKDGRGFQKGELPNAENCSKWI